MKFKVHWIIDGIMEIDSNSKEEAEDILQKDLEEYVKNSDTLMNKFIAKSIQGTAYNAGKDETSDITEESDDEKTS